MIKSGRNKHKQQQLRPTEREALDNVYSILRESGMGLRALIKSNRRKRLLITRLSCITSSPVKKQYPSLFTYFNHTERIHAHADDSF